MGNLQVYQRSGERYLFLLIVFGALATAPQGRADEALPFDPAKITRLSIDNIPRSIAIRQGADVWSGYDLEKALVFKVWQAATDKPGVIIKDFNAQSAGTVLFEVEAGEQWQLQREGEIVPLHVRYLGCSQHEESFELRWELSCSDGTITLRERIATASSAPLSRASRELRVESLESGASLILPSAYREAWLLTGPEGKPVKTIAGLAWHKLSLR